MSVAEREVSVRASPVPCVPCLDKLDRLEWATERSYDFGGGAVGVRATDTALLSWLDRALADRRTSEAKRPTYSVVVGESPARRAGRGIHILYRGTEAIVRTESLRTLGRSLLDDLTAHLLHERTDAFYLALAPVARDERLALVSASFLAPLTASSRRAARAGIGLPARAWVAIRPGTADVIPPPNVLGVPDDIADELSDNGSNAAHSVIDDPRAAGAILVQARGSAELRTISPAEALYRVAGSTINLRALGGDALGGLVPLIRSCDAYAAPAGSKDVLASLEVVLSAASSSGV
jgi:hypothetical protein